MILATNAGLIVFSNWKLHKVTAMTDQGSSVWEYTNPKLKQPYGLDEDSIGNIYIAGRISNNIHVLSGTGELIRVFKDILRPTFFRVNEEMGIICVCSKSKDIKMFEI
jgi:hypothetical protein